VSAARSTRLPEHRHVHGGEPRLDGLRVALQLAIPSDVSYIERVVELVARQCEELRYGARYCSLNVPVALTEALSNAILRGNKEDAAKRVHVRVELDADRIMLEVRDEGEGFDLDTCLVDPTDAEHIEREDGRGLFLMSRLMDHVEAFSRDGNVVRMTLHRHD
jgi:serine/threonine-protein kinase RsbW